ncbi:DUF4397 domain-containing protein [Halomonadaceae bacterium KBTZ08]
MESPARAALLLAVTLGLSGCFDSQKDETFEDTVVPDDVAMRVLHAVPDAPALRLEADGDVPVDKLEYGKVTTVDLPAHDYRFQAQGYTGGEAPAPLLDTLEANLSEDRRHDVLLMGSLQDDNVRALVLDQDDDPFEPEEEAEEGDGETGNSDSEEEDEPEGNVRLRLAHLVPEAGAVDLYLKADVSGDPDATLASGQASDAIRVEEGVYQLTITPADSSEVIYQSDPSLGWESGDDVLLAVTPATGVLASNDSELSLIEVDGNQTQRLPGQAQAAELAFVNASGSAVDLTTEDGALSRTGVGSIQAEPAEGYLGVESRHYPIDFVAGNQGCDYCYDIRLGQGKAGTLVLRQLPSASSESAVASFLTHDARPVATNARLRIANALSANQVPVDLYLIESGCNASGSLPEDGIIPEPLVSNLDYPNRSSMLPVPEGNYQLVVTAQGNPANEFLCESITPEKRSIHELILAQEPGSNNPLELVRVGGVR